MNFLKQVQEVNNIDITDKVKLIYDSVKKNVDEKIDKFLSSTYNKIHEVVLNQRKDSVTEYHIHTLEIYLNSKNELFQLAKDPIYSFCLDEINFEYLNRLCAIYLLEPKPQSINGFLDDFHITLEKITYHDRIINLSEWIEQKFQFSSNSDNIKHPFFESLYIGFLRAKVQGLIEDKNEFKEFLIDNVFGWNILSLGYFYHFLRKNEILLAETSFTQFKNYLHPSNREMIYFNLYLTSYTKPDLNFIINCLKSYFYADRNIFKDWVLHKIRYKTKHNNLSYGDDFEIQTSSTFNRLDKTHSNKNEKEVLFIFRTVDLLENSTTYLNQS